MKYPNLNVSAQENFLSGNTHSRISRNIHRMTNNDTKIQEIKCTEQKPLLGMTNYTLGPLYNVILLPSIGALPALSKLS